MIDGMERKGIKIKINKNKEQQQEEEEEHSRSRIGGVGTRASWIYKNQVCHWVHYPVSVFFLNLVSIYFWVYHGLSRLPTKR